MLCDLKNRKSKCYTENTRALENLFVSTPIFKRNSGVSESLFERNQKFNLALFSSYFACVRFGSIAELNQTHFLDWVRFSSIEIQFDKVRLTMDKTTYLFIAKERKEEYNNNLKLISWTFKRGAKRLNKGKTDWRTAIGHWSVHNRARDRLKCGNSSEGSIINNLTEEALLLWYLSFYWHRFHDNRFAFSRLRKGQR